MIENQAISAPNRLPENGLQGEKLHPDGLHPIEAEKAGLKRPMMLKEGMKLNLMPMAIEKLKWMEMFAKRVLS